MVAIGDPAPNSTWQIAWRDGALVAGETILLSDCLGKVVVLLLAKPGSS